MNSSDLLRVQAWIESSDEHAVCAEAIAYFLGYGIRHEQNTIPSNNVEFAACLDLLEEVPVLRTSLSGMSKYSAQWQVMVQRWPAVETTYRSEAGSKQYQMTNMMLRTPLSLAEILSAFVPGIGMTARQLGEILDMTPAKARALMASTDRLVMTSVEEVEKFWLTGTQPQVAKKSYLSSIFERPEWTGYGEMLRKRVPRVG